MTVAEREVMICSSTGNRVVMEYTGRPCEDGKTNGHPGWLCLHEDDEDADEEAVKQFLLDRENR